MLISFLRSHFEERRPQHAFQDCISYLRRTGCPQEKSGCCHLHHRSEDTAGRIYCKGQDGTEFCPSDYEAIIHPTKPEKVVLTMDNVIQFLGERGADQETLKQIKRQCALTQASP